MAAVVVVGHLAVAADGPLAVVAVVARLAAAA
jgi:hypothetical protein